MTPNERRLADVPRPIESVRDAWESGGRSLSDALVQAQEFWNSVARSWGESLGLWLGQPPLAQRQDSTAALRELQEAALGLAQAWFRLPLVLTGPAAAIDFQRALLRLIEANARLSPLWPQPLTRPLDARR